MLSSHLLIAHPSRGGCWNKSYMGSWPDSPPCESLATRDYFGVGGTSTAEGGQSRVSSPSRGVWGHARPGKFWEFGAQIHHLRAFPVWHELYFIQQTSDWHIDSHNSDRYCALFEISKSRWSQAINMQCCNARAHGPHELIHERR